MMLIIDMNSSFLIVVVNVILCGKITKNARYHNNLIM